MKNNKKYNNNVLNLNKWFSDGETCFYLRINRKGFHTLPNPVVPVKVWDNPDKQKLEILRENKGKSGIYM
jgi:hypothetical protein